jgi:hypothetical protein
VRHYAVREDTGERVLVELECDQCGATIKPGPDISRSGWTKRGWYRGPGTEVFENEYCPECSAWVGLGGA